MKDNYEDMRAWVGVDLDGTLAHTLEPFDPTMIGMEIVPMVKLVKGFLEQERRVKIFTARVCVTGQSSDVGKADKHFANGQHFLISQWCLMVFGVDLEVTCIKDFLCEQLYDDRAWRVELNTGKVIGEHYSMVMPGAYNPVPEWQPPNVADVMERLEDEEICYCPKDGHSELCPIHKTKSSPR